MNVYLATVLAFLIYLVVVWFTGTALHLQGRDLWILRGLLAFIGAIASVVFLWFYTRLKQKTTASGGSAPSGVQGDADIQQVLRKAEANLRSSKLGRTASLKQLPVVFLLGDS